MKKTALLATFLLASLGLAACGPETPSISSSGEISSSQEGSSSDSSIDIGILVHSISLSLDKEKVEVGDEVQATITVSPANATNPNVLLRANPADSVQIEGKTIKTLKSGTVEIIAESEDHNATASVTLTIEERRNRVDDKVFLNAIHTTPYATNTYPTSEGWGLNEAGKVGVNQATFDEERYPVPTESVSVFYVSDYGIAPGAVNNAGKLSNLLNEVGAKEGTKVVYFENGVYEFGNSITVTSAKDVYLVGKEGTKLMFTGWMSYFRFTACENFHLNNLVLDMNPSPTITGTVVSSEEDSSNGYVYVRPDAEYDLTNAEYEKYELRHTGSYAEYYFDEEFQSYVPDRSGNLFYDPGLKDMVYDRDTGLLKCTLSKSFRPCAYKAPKAGTIVGIGFQVYENMGFYYRNCINSYMENVEVYVVPGMGFRSDNGKNVYLNRVRFIREPGTKRLLTCTADILHTCNLEGDAIFSNCILEGSHDDGVNVKSFYTSVTAIRNNKVTVAQTQSEVTIAFDVGDQVDVYDPNGMKYKDTFYVEEVEKSGSSYILTIDKNMPSRGSNSYIGFSLGNATKAVHLTLENTIIRNKRNRGVLLQGRHSTVRNCTFENVNMGALQILSVDDRFKEAIVPEDVIVENNKFLKCWDDVSIFTWDAKGVATPGTLKDVTVQNNYFYHGVGSSVFLKGAGDIKVRNNLFHEQGKTYALRAEQVDGAILEDNATYFDTNVTNYQFASLRSGVTNVTEKNNTIKGVLA